MEFRRLWDVIWRRKWIILITFFAFSSLVVILTKIATPVYEAKAKILVGSSDTLSSLMSSLGLTTTGANFPSTQNETYSTDIALIKIKPILDRLISKLDLKDRDGETITSVDLIETNTIVNKISPQPYVKVEQVEDSDILAIISDSPDPIEAARMSNELARLYIDFRIDIARKEYKAARLFLENKIKSIKEKYYKSLVEKKNFMIKEATVDLRTEIKILLEYISDLKEKYNENEINIAQADENIKLIEEKIGGKKYVSSDLFNSLEVKLSELLMEVSGKSIDFSEEHPDIKQLNKQIDTLKEILNERANIVFNDKKVSITPVYEKLVEDLKDAYINKRIGEIQRDLLKRYIDKSQEDLIKIPSKSIKDSEIELSLSVNQDVYKTLLEYQTQVGVAESMTLSNIKLVEPATKPTDPDFPKKALCYLLGIILGLFWGFSFGFLIEYIDNTIKRPDDLKAYRFTFLGSIPKFKLKSKEKPLISKMDPNDPKYEAYRKILSNIYLTKIDSPPRKILISSVSPKGGSSTTVANLGIILAREERKVLLVDTDLRRPSLHELFELSNAKGLVDLFSGNVQIKEVVQETGINGLSVLTAGSKPPDPGLLIQSKKMRDIVKNLEERYEILIFDSAPLLIKNDAILLRSYLDDIVIVLKNKQNSYQDISMIDELLKNANIDPMGVVLNLYKYS